MIPESVVLPVWSHSTKKSVHEPIMLDFSPVIKSSVVTSSRRTPMFDKARLQDADVQSHIKRELARLSTPPAFLEQFTHNFLLSRAIRGIVEQAAPKEKKPRTNHWISERTRQIVEYRDEALKLFRRLGRALKKCHSDVAGMSSKGGDKSDAPAPDIAVETVNEAATDTCYGDGLDVLIRRAKGFLVGGKPAGVIRSVPVRTINALYQRAIRLRDERDALSLQLDWYGTVIKACVRSDKADRITSTSKRMAHQAEFGICTGFHRAIKPLKRKATAARLLLKDSDGNLCANKCEQGLAVKSYLAIKGRGTLTSIEEHIERSRCRDNGPLPVILDTGL